MVLANFLFVTLNILILIFGYLIIKSKIEKKVINKEIINKIKEEVNDLIVKLNETTYNNISLVEERVKKLDRLLKIVDRKIAGLDVKIIDKAETLDNLSKKTENFIYSPDKIIKQNLKSAENNTNNNLELNNQIQKENEISDAFKSLSSMDKARILIEKGVDEKEIKKQTGLSSGELELLLNIEKMKKN